MSVANLMIARMGETEKAQQARRDSDKHAITTYLDTNFDPALLEAVQSVEYVPSSRAKRVARGSWVLLCNQAWFVMSAQAAGFPANTNVIVSVAVGATQEEAEAAAATGCDPEGNHRIVDNTQELLDFLIDYDSATN